MDCAGASAGHSSIGSSNHVALGDIGTYSLRVLYGRPRAASHLSLFRRTNRLIARRRGEPSLFTSGSVHDSTRLILQPRFRAPLRQKGLVDRHCHGKWPHTVQWQGAQPACYVDNRERPRKAFTRSNPGGCLSTEASWPR